MRSWLPLLLVVLTSFSVPSGNMCAADPTAAAAQPAVATAEPRSDGLAYSPQWPEPPNTGAMLLRLALGTAFVLVLCVGSLWLGKPWLQKLQGTGTTNKALQIEGSVSLGNRAVLYLVKVGDTQLVAGTDATGLKSLIALPSSFKEVLDEQLPADELHAEQPVATVDPQNFEFRLRAATGS